MKLEAKGRWAEIRKRHAELLAAVAETDAETRARAHLLVSRGYYFTATSGADWRECLRHNRIALDLAPAGSWWQAWAIQRMGSILSDMGKRRQAKPFSLAFLKLAPKFPQAKGRLPYVYRDLARIAQSERNYFQAVAYERKAQQLFRGLGQDDEAERSNTAIVWHYTKAGRPDLARRVDMSRVPASSEYAVLGALASIHAAEGRWIEALRVGRLALEGARRSCDYADAAEVCFIIAEAARRLGVKAQVTVYIGRAKKFAVNQGWSVHDTLGLGLEQRGGVLLDAHPADSTGSGGYHPDSCYTTGVA